MLAEGRKASHSGTKPDPRRGERRGELLWRVLEIASRQFGVVSLGQLLDCGLNASTVRGWVAAGRLHRIHSGVFAVGRRDLVARGRWLGAVLTCGEAAFLSYASAGALHAFRASLAVKIDVTVARRSALRRAGIRIHRHPELTAVDVTEIDGIPVTSVSRTLLDLATVLSEPQLERACDQCAVNQIFDMRDMSDLLRRSHGARGVARLRNVLARGDLGENVPASGLERRYRDLCAAHGLPQPEINRWILLGDDYHKVDFLWRKERVVVEVDGGPFHSTGWQRRRDARRDALLDEHGYRHGRFSDTQINGHPADVVAQTRALLH